MSGTIEGFIALNLVFAAAGSSVIWASRGIRDARDLIEIAAPALLIGAACVGLLATFRVYSGGDLSRIAVLALAGLVSFAAVTFGALRRRTARVPLVPWHPRPRARLSSAAWLLAPTAGVFAVLLLAVAGVQAPTNQNGSPVWITRAAAITFADGHAQIALDHAAGHTTEPLFVPALQAMDFTFARSVDPATIGLEYWTLYVAFLLTVFLLLRRFAPAWLVCLALVLSVFAPEVGTSITSAQSDLPFAIFFASAGLFLAVWITMRATWLLVAFAATLSAAVAATTYGQLLAVCLAGGGALAVIGDASRRWLRPIAAASAALISATPFFVWAHHHDLGGSVVPLLPTGSDTTVDSAWEGMTTAARVVFSYHVSLLAVPVALTAAAALLVLRSPTRAVPKLVLGTTVFVGIGVAMTVISSPQIVTSAPAVGAAVALFSIAVTPLLLAPLLSSAEGDASSPTETTCDAQSDSRQGVLRLEPP
jgi:hypothetical protein